MKKRKFVRRMLRPKLLLVYLLVIFIAVFVCSYAFGGMNAYDLNVRADNLEYDFSKFTDINDMDLSDLKIDVVKVGEVGKEKVFTILNYKQENKDSGKSEAELEKDFKNDSSKTSVTLAEYINLSKIAGSQLTDADLTNEFNEAYALLPGEKIAENSKYYLYFNKISTIATVYERDGSLPVDQLKRYYSTAVPGLDGKSSNVEVNYLDAKKGSVVNDTINSTSGSTHYKNTLTGEIEKHFALRFTQNGVQIAYQIGKFDAGEAYFPSYFYSTIYKPEKGAFINRKGEFNEEAYNAHVEMWVEYMAMLGLDNAMEASYEEITAALSKTFEEIFRGNAQPTMTTKQVGSKKVTKFSGSLKVYTREAATYVKDLIDNGTIIGGYSNADDPDEVAKFVENGSGYDGKTNNVYWNFINIDSSFFEEGEGKYFNCEESPLTINLKMVGDAYGQFSKNTVYEEFVGMTEKPNEEEGSTEGLYIPYTYRQAKPMGAVIQTQIYNLLYNDIQFYDNIYGYEYEFENGEPFMQGGMFEFDEDGYRVYDENGVAKTTHMTLEKAADFNSVFAVESSSSLPIFGLALDFTLNEDGLDVTLLGDSLVDFSTVENGKDVAINKLGHTIGTYNNRYSYTNIKVLPYMNYEEVEDENNKETGMIVVPDGSGALINFNNGKANMLATAVNSQYYGKDLTYTSTIIEEETEDLMLGMYGFIYTTPSNPRGVLSILEKGGNQVSLFANTTDVESQAYFTCKVRESKDIRIGASATSTPFTKWSYNICDTDFKFKYIFLGEDQADYISLANKYREYLQKRDGLVDKDSSTSTVVDLNFLGAFEKYALFLGFKYKTPDHLTTFEQAKEIIDELSNGINVNGKTMKVNDFNVSYTAWTSEEMEYQTGKGISVSSTLGGKKDMREFSAYLDSKNIDLYPELYVSTTLGYDLSFGNIRYTSRNIANETAVRYQFDLATQRVNKKLAATYMIRPDFYSEIATTTLEKVEKLNLTQNNTNDKKLGYYLVDLGNLTSNHYGKNEEIYGDAAIQFQKDALAVIAQNSKIKIKAPYDYALKYADFITDVPTTSTQKQIYDEIIPLYQLVISGLVDYTVETINGTGSRGASWYYAKALETGSNLSFQLSYQNPAILLNTDYTYYYQAYYNNWREEIVTMASNIDALGIHGGRLVYHKNVAKNIANVKYLLENGSTVELIVNTTVSDYNYNGTIIPAYNYVLVA